ncbi:helix-turn-helix domain-containing protein [Novosphingobium sp.]|uniref:helix-turn-helix domain-containing protein n=1 Tax=Novosphingobium sp. TaxID=1874826 RepID=UPI0038B99523
MIERFSTQAEAPGRRLDFWNRIVGETYDGLVVDTMRQDFAAEMLRWRLGDLTMIWPRSCGVTVRRRPEAARHMDRQRVVLHIAQETAPTLTERGREVTLRTGDLVLCAAEDAYCWDVASQHQMLVVEIDRDRLGDRIAGLDDCIARSIPRELPTSRLLHRFVLSLWREGGQDLDPASAAAYADSLTTMIVASLCGARDDGLDCSGVLDRMHAAIAVHAHDPALTPASLASAIGVPLRTLQAAAAGAGTTPRHAITQRRMSLAAEDLAIRRNVPITEIAFDCGFTDSGHFARRFQDRFGMTPTEYRRRH